MALLSEDLPSATAPDQSEPTDSRADRPVSETVERFLKAVIAKVPLADIEVLHLFSPLRQGTVETGIAVLAARRPLVSLVADMSSDSVDPVVELPLESVEVAHGNVESTVGEFPDDVDTSNASEVLDLVPDVLVDAQAAPENGAADRHTVYTARYRYTIKGPERGKWEASIRAEADAPLLTVETVVRGVQRRSGEDSEIVCYSSLQIARALRISLQKDVNEDDRGS